jgi:L-ascorbate metabolism protein UlaG (beta-lactamase superfamily)
MTTKWGALFSLLLFAQVAHADLSRYSALVVQDKVPQPGNSVRITYLGVNGYQLEAGDHALLIDPYFTRVGLTRVALNQPIAPDEARISAGLSYVRPRIDAVLVTHAHFDHLLDVPEVMRRTGSLLVADSTAANLVQSLGTTGGRCSVVRPGDRKHIGPWTIRVFAAKHDRVIGPNPPYPGTVNAKTRPPTNPSDWKLGQPLAFLIEANGQRIYIESGGMPNDPLPRLGKIDLAILGVALPDSRRRYPSAVRSLHPRYVLPSHQDDFFAPFDRGFSFGKLTNFPAILRTHETEHLPGRLILLDYFRPWTIR